jgi:HSP20 family protein
MFRRPFFDYGVTPPWQEMARLQREMNRLFDAFSLAGGQIGPNYPAMNVRTNDEGAVVTAELPGIDPEDIDISVVGDTLTLSGSLQPETLKEGETYHRRERGFGKFRRIFQLPFQVETDQVEASFKNGVLSISLPRAEQDKSKKIVVESTQKKLEAK